MICLPALGFTTGLLELPFGGKSRQRRQGQMDGTLAKSKAKPLLLSPCHLILFLSQDFFFFFWTASKCLSFRIRLYIPASPLHSFSSVPPFFFPIILPFPRYLLRKQSIQKISIIIINMYLLCTRHCAECFINFVPVHVHNYAIR